MTIRPMSFAPYCPRCRTHLNETRNPDTGARDIPTFQTHRLAVEAAKKAGWFVSLIATIDSDPVVCLCANCGEESGLSSRAFAAKRHADNGAATEDEICLVAFPKMGMERHVIRHRCPEINTLGPILITFVAPDDLDHDCLHCGKRFRGVP